MSDDPKREKTPGSGRKAGTPNRRSRTFDRLFGTWLTNPQTVKTIKSLAREDAALMRWLLARQFGNPIQTQPDTGESLLDYLKALEEARPHEPAAGIKHQSDPAGSVEPAAESVPVETGWGPSGEPN